MTDAAAGANPRPWEMLSAEVQPWDLIEALTLATTQPCLCWPWGPVSAPFLVPVKSFAEA